MQTRGGALAEERRRLAAVAATGSPFEIVNETARAQVAPEPPRAITFADAADSYLTEFAPSHLKPTSQYSYGVGIRVHLKPFFGKLTLPEITAKTVREFDTAMVRGANSISTRRNAHITLRSILCKFAIEADLLDRAPRLPPLPKRGETIPNTMTEEEFGRVVGAVRSPGHRLLILLAGHAGLRHGELRALRCGDVDLTNGSIVVRKSIARGTETEPKSGSHREVPLTPELCDALRDVGADKRDRRERVALTRAGRPWGHNGIRNVFERALKRAGVSHWRLHDSASLLRDGALPAGIPLHVVRELAGHADLSTTQRYAHLRSGDRSAAIASLSAALASKKKVEG